MTSKLTVDFNEEINLRISSFNKNGINFRIESATDFPFHLVLTGDCKVLNGWLSQMMDVADKDDLNILFMKFNRKGKFVCVQAKYTWITDQFMYYTSPTMGDWILIEFDHFFKLNKKLVKTYSGSTDTTSIKNIQTTNILPTLTH